MHNSKNSHFADCFLGFGDGAALFELYEFITAQKFGGQDNRLMESEILFRIMRFLWQKASDSVHFRTVVSWLARFVFCSLDALKVDPTNILKPTEQPFSKAKHEGGSFRRLRHMFVEKPPAGPVKETITVKLQNLELKVQERRRRVPGKEVDLGEVAKTGKTCEEPESPIREQTCDFESDEFSRHLTGNCALFRTKFVPYKHVYLGLQELFISSQERAKELRKRVHELKSGMVELNGRLEECLRKEVAEQQAQTIRELEAKCLKLRREKFDLLRVSLTNAFELINRKGLGPEKGPRPQSQRAKDAPGTTEGALPEQLKESLQRRVGVLTERVACLSKLYVELEDAVHFNVLRMQTGSRGAVRKAKGFAEGQAEASVQRLFAEMEGLREKFNLVC